MTGDQVSQLLAAQAAQNQAMMEGLNDQSGAPGSGGLHPALAGNMGLMMNPMQMPPMYGTPPLGDPASNMARQYLGITSAAANLPASLGGSAFEGASFAASMGVLGGPVGLAASFLDPTGTGGLSIATGVMGTNAWLRASGLGSGSGLSRLTSGMRAVLGGAKTFGGLGTGALAAGGGLLAGYVAFKGAEAVVDYATENINTGIMQQSNLQTMLMSPDRMLMPDMGTVTSQDVLGVRNMFADMSEADPKMSVDQLTQLSSSMMQRGEFRNTTNISEFKTKFNETLEALKDVSAVMNSSLDEAYQFLEAQKTSGFFDRGDQVANAMMVRTMARTGGISTETVQRGGAYGAQMFRAMGASPAGGAVMMEQQLGMLGLGKREGVISDEDLFMATGAYGEQGMSVFAQQMTQEAFRLMRGRRGRRLTAALMDPETGHIDVGRARAFAEGAYEFEDITRMARENLSSRQGRLAFRANRRQLAGELIEDAGPAQIVATDIENIIERQFGSTSLNPEEEELARTIMRRRYTGLSDAQLDVAMDMAQAAPRLRTQAQVEAAQMQANEPMAALQIPSLSEVGGLFVKQLFAPTTAGLQRIGANFEAGVTNWIERQLGGTVTVSPEVDRAFQYSILGSPYAPTGTPQLGNLFNGDVVESSEGVFQRGRAFPMRSTQDFTPVRTSSITPGMGLMEMGKASYQDFMQQGQDFFVGLGSMLDYNVAAPENAYVTDSRMLKAYKEFGLVEDASNISLAEIRNDPGAQYLIASEGGRLRGLRSPKTVSQVASEGGWDKALASGVTEGLASFMFPAYGMYSGAASFVNTVAGEDVVPTVSDTSLGRKVSDELITPAVGVALGATDFELYAMSALAESFDLGGWGPTATTRVDAVRVSQEQELPIMQFNKEVRDRLNSIDGDLANATGVPPTTEEAVDLMMSDIRFSIASGELGVTPDELADMGEIEKFNAVYRGLQRNGRGEDAQRLRAVATDSKGMIAVMGRIGGEDAAYSVVSGLPGKVTRRAAYERVTNYENVVQKAEADLRGRYNGLDKLDPVRMLANKYQGRFYDIPGMPEFASLVTDMQGGNISHQGFQRMDELQQQMVEHLADTTGMTPSQARTLVGDIKKQTGDMAAFAEAGDAGRAAEAMQTRIKYTDYVDQMVDSPAAGGLSYVRGGGRILSQLKGMTSGDNLVTGEQIGDFYDTISEIALDPNITKEERANLAELLEQQGPLGASGAAVLRRAPGERKRVGRLSRKLDTTSEESREKFIARALSPLAKGPGGAALRAIIEGGSKNDFIDLSSPAVFSDLIEAAQEPAQKEAIRDLQRAIESGSPEERAAALDKFAEHSSLVFPSTAGKYGAGGPQGQFAELLTEMTNLTKTMNDVSGKQSEILSYVPKQSEGGGQKPTSGEED